MYKNRNELLEDSIFIDYSNLRNIAETTKASQATSLLRYCKYHEKTLQELYDEADSEEEEGKRAKKRKIVKRIANYRQYMIDEKFSPNTTQGALVVVKTFYKTMGIEIPYIPPAILPKRQLLYDDIPNKEHIKQAIESTNSKLHKAIILFQYSSCSALAETLSVTCKMFVDATKEYHDETDIKKVVPILKKQKDVIPFFLMSRQKRSNVVEEGYKYYTCCTPEATRYILNYLEERINKKGELKNKDKLFKIGEYGVSSAYLRINDKNNWPKIGESRFFRSHTMRIAGSTAIEDEAIGDLFSGRKRNPIHEGYFKRNPKRIKEIYLRYIRDLTIEETDVFVVENEVAKKLAKKYKKDMEILETKHKQEMENIEEESKATKKELNIIKDDMKEFKDIIGQKKEEKEKEKLINEICDDENLIDILNYIHSEREDIDVKNIELLREVVNLKEKKDLSKWKKNEIKKAIYEIIDKVEPIDKMRIISKSLGKSNSVIKSLVGDKVLLENLAKEVFEQMNTPFIKKEKK